MALISIKRIIFSSIIFILSELLAHLKHSSLDPIIYKWHLEWHTQTQCKLPKYMLFFNLQKLSQYLPHVTPKLYVLKYFVKCVSQREVLKPFQCQTLIITDRSSTCSFTYVPPQQNLQGLIYSLSPIPSSPLSSKTSLLFKFQ